MKSRAYLLGTLDDQTATLLEEEYFGNAAKFREMQAAEVVLIRDFLAGRLTAADRKLFESKYLAVPELARRVERVRLADATRVPRHSQPVHWLRPALVTAALVLILCGAWFWWLRPGSAPVPIAELPIQTSPVILALSPGVVMGAAAKPATLALPAPETLVRLVLELPGLFEPADFTVQVSRVGEPPVDVWVSPSPVPSEASAGSQVVACELRSSLLLPADYIVTVRDKTGGVRERYLFHTTAR